MNKEKLKEILLDQKDVFSNNKHLMIRNIELDKYISSSQIIIISGVRRCGKSSLLYLIKEKMNLQDNAFCYFNFDDERITPNVLLPEQIYNLHLELYGQDAVLFLDEVQNIPFWEKFVNRMYEQGIKVFVTGSNAQMLSSEISTSITGRNKVIELYPFSFSEYLRFKENDIDPEKVSAKRKALILKDFNQYMQKGGFPLVVKENDLELLNAYFQDIFYRDIIARYSLTQVNEIRQIGQYFASNTSKRFSYSTLQEISGVKSSSSIKDYLYYYSQSYLFFYISKFDYSVKKQIRNQKKVYTVDTGFSNRIGFNFSENKGRILENIVFLELCRRNCEIYYHSAKHECDFVIRKGNEVTEAIQVCYQLEANNKDREYKGLQEAMQQYNLKNGILLTYDETQSEYENITVLPVWKWLIDNNITV